MGERENANTEVVALLRRKRLIKERATAGMIHWKPFDSLMAYT